MDPDSPSTIGRGWSNTSSPTSLSPKHLRNTSGRGLWFGSVCGGEEVSRRFTDRRRVRQMGKKMKGAKILKTLALRKYAATRLKQSRALPSASRSSADVSGWLSFNSPQSILSALSHSSLLSFVSIASIGSGASILSIGSVGSILSIGSAGSILSIGSAGSILSIGKAGTAPGTGSVEPEPEILLEEEEILPEPEVLIEEEEITQEMPATGEPRPEEMPPDPMP